MSKLFKICIVFLLSSVIYLVNLPDNILSNDEKSTLANEYLSKIESSFLLGKTKYTLTLPKNYEVVECNDTEVRFFKYGVLKGGVSIIAYYGNMPSTTQNELLESEPIKSNLGDGTVYISRYSNSASEEEHTEWLEAQAIIPIPNKPLAYEVFYILDESALDKDKGTFKDIVSSLDLY